MEADIAYFSKNKSSQSCYKLKYKNINPRKIFILDVGGECWLKGDYRWS